MPALAKLTSAGQVTLPKAIRKKANMQPGDFVEVELNRKGHVVLKPKKLIDASEAWFWTPEWQNAEREAQEDLKAGRFKRFKSADELIAHLDSED